jgi:hypothetical protein
MQIQIYSLLNSSRPGEPLQTGTTPNKQHKEAHRKGEVGGSRGEGGLELDIDRQGK